MVDATKYVGRRWPPIKLWILDFRCESFPIESQREAIWQVSWNRLELEHKTSIGKRKLESSFAKPPKIQVAMTFLTIAGILT